MCSLFGIWESIKVAPADLQLIEKGYIVIVMH